MAKGDTTQNPPNAVAGAAFRPPFFPKVIPFNNPNTPGNTQMSAGPASAPTLASQGFGQQTMGVGPSGSMPGMPPSAGQTPVMFHHQAQIGAGPSPSSFENMLQAFLNHLQSQRQLPVGQNTQGQFNPPTQPTGGPVRTAPLTQNRQV